MNMTMSVLYFVESFFFDKGENGEVLLSLRIIIELFLDNMSNNLCLTSCCENKRVHWKAWLIVEKTREVYYCPLDHKL